MTKLKLLLFVVLAIVPGWSSDTVHTKVRAAVFDRDLNVKPVPRLVVKFVAMEAPSTSPIVVQTNLDGIAEVELPAGKYRVLTDKAIEVLDKAYTWDFETNVDLIHATVELSNDNARIAPLAGGRDARVDELVGQYKRVKDVLVTVWTEHGAADGLVVDASGLVVTVERPLLGSNWLAVQLDDHRKLPATVIASDKQHDVAVLRFNPTAAGQIPAAQLSTDPGALLEGERVFSIENPGKDSDKKMITGVLSKADANQLVTDVKPPYASAVLFNSSGNAVGLAQLSGRDVKFSPIAIVSSTIKEAREKMTATGAPASKLLPTMPTDQYPIESLRAPGRGTWEKDVYSFKAGDFTIELVTPVAQYESDTERYGRALKEYNKHKSRSEPPAEPDHKYRPMLLVAAEPETKTSWGKSFLVSAATNGGGPAIRHYKTGFLKMRLLCGDKEVEPIWPARFVSGDDSRNRSVYVEDEAYNGRYMYPHSAISPQCGKVTLQLFSTKDPDHPSEKVLDERIVSRIWQDFEAYRRLQQVNTASQQ